jgi:L-seryl-tRNA(Ser) seleniumtransferase
MTVARAAQTPRNPNVSEPHKHQFHRSIPSVDEILAHASLQPWRAAWPRFPWAMLVRTVLAELRGAAEPPVPAERAAVSAWVVGEVSRRLERLRTGGLRPVLNGTGVVLHTNLGRAPVGAKAATAALRALQEYSSLEVDLDTGERSKRAGVVEAMLCLLTGAESAMVVNNNAAAVYLVANSFSPPGRVIVSRGELVEIGGSFRLPEILRHAAHEVVEVGTTNRTYAADYEQAARPGDLFLKVHKSNYAIEGFAHETSASELVAVARACGCRVAFDLGSGAFVDFAALGFGRDPLAADVAREGVDGVTMSGDKLLGGVQAGIVVGTREFVDRLQQNPLRRAVRVDKVTVAALQEVMRAYLFAPVPDEEVPVVAAIKRDPAQLRERAERVAGDVARAVGSAWRVGVGDDEATVGGGSLTGAVVPSAAVTIRCGNDREATRLARELRLRPLPLLVRVRGDELRVNMTTIFPTQEETLTRLLVEFLRGVDAPESPRDRG